MTHAIRPTPWDAEVCADCGFPVELHEVLYGTDQSIGGGE